MKVQHLTYLSGHSLDRNTKDILPHTVEHFKNFQISKGSMTTPIEKTDLECKLTVQNKAAVFTFFKVDDGTPLITVYAAFGDNDDSEMIWGLLKKNAKQDPFFASAALPKPKGNMWLYSYIQFPSAPPTMSLIGEISFYIWNAVYLAVSK